MKKDITIKEIEKFKNYYNKIKRNELSTNLQELSLNEVSLNKKVKEENKFEFNVELGDCKIYNQYSSSRCWLFACLNLIKNNVADNSNIHPLEFALSPNHTTFFDKLEKANHLYETIINYKFPTQNYNPFDLAMIDFWRNI